jgi:lipoprotein-anchoring transpeptidase ErfK/SrfK
MVGWRQFEHPAGRAGAPASVPKSTRRYRRRLQTSFSPIFALISALFEQQMMSSHALEGQTVPKSALAWLLVGLLGLVLVGCTQSTLSPTLGASFTQRDRQLLANPPYAQASIPEQYRRHIVDHPYKETPGTILVDSDARYLYYVLPQGKAIRYGVAVGEEAMAWSGIATVGRMSEWPDWIPTPEIQARLGPYPRRVPGGPENPLGARALYLYEGSKDTLYRIHGTNQPEYIGQAISSGCIRMTNEDVIDLYDRVKQGTIVVVLAPGQAGRMRGFTARHS